MKVGNTKIGQGRWVMCIEIIQSSFVPLFIFISVLSALLFLSLVFVSLLLTKQYIIRAVPTLCKWAWSLFLASVVCLTLVLNELLTLLNWFHISLAHARRVLSISPRRRSEAALSFWDRAMFSWVYLTQESGIVMLWVQITEFLKQKDAYYAALEYAGQYFILTLYKCTILPMLTETLHVVWNGH